MIGIGHGGLGYMYILFPVILVLAFLHVHNLTLVVYVLAVVWECV